MKKITFVFIAVILFNIANAQNVTAPAVNFMPAQFVLLPQGSPVGSYTTGIAYLYQVPVNNNGNLSAYVFVADGRGNLVPVPVWGEIRKNPGNWNTEFFEIGNIVAHEDKKLNLTSYTYIIPKAVRVQMFINISGQQSYAFFL